MTKEKKKVKIIIVDDYSLMKEYDSNSVVITATQNLKDNKLFEGAKCTMSFSDLLSKAKNNIDYSRCLNSTELRYIIHKSIEEIFDSEKATTYKHCIFNLEELYSKLILNDISDKDFSKLDFHKYGFVEKEIFELYNKVYSTLQNNKHKILKKCIIEEACKILDDSISMVFVGFVFFNDLQENFIKHINCDNITFVNKKDSFIKDDLLIPLINKLGYAYTVNTISNTNGSIFNMIEDNLFTNNEIDIKDKGLIEIYKPFSNREQEFLFIAEEISNKLKEMNIEPEQVQHAIRDFAVVLTKNKSTLSKILNDALAQVGVFIPHEKGYKNLKPIYYSKQEFLSESIYKGKKELSYIEKVKLFDNFQRIKVTGTQLQSEDFPIGQFIVEVYKVVANDLEIESFKTLINTQWYLNQAADNKYIQDFYKLESYFINIKTLEQWKSQVQNLIDLKNIICQEQYFEMHPLVVVELESLKYIQNYLKFLENLIINLKTNSNIKNQIEILIKSFNLRDVKLPTEGEQETLKLFVDMLTNIESNETIEVDYKYFAEHIKELINQFYDSQQKEKNSLKLAVVNMENYTKYDYVYFPMFEDNKYPRILTPEFPFTGNIVEIIKELGLDLQKNQDLDYHLKMSRHIFKNVFGFVKKRITFTYISKENGNDIDISPYSKDIRKVIKNKIQDKEKTDEPIGNIANSRELIFKDAQIKELNINQLLSRFLCPKQFYCSIKLSDKQCYKDNFLLNFYAKALIVNRFFINLGKSDRDYLLESEEFYQCVENLFEQTYSEIMKYFLMFTQNEMKDIRITSKKYINDFIETHFKQGKFASNRCAFRIGKEKIIDDTIKVKSRSTIIMIDLNKRIETAFDISKSLDFLISSCGGKKYEYKHFDDIIEQLESGTRFDDKMSLVNFASFKINTQLNNTKFHGDGIKRIKSLISYTPTEYSNMGETLSSYCRFCKLKSVCKGVLIDD